jgi:GT2 family glycosyltransferase/glycosyltransferase involved in cell wall biosynthesis
VAATSPPFHDNVSVVVLNFNRAQTTLQCLDALHRAHSDLVHEVIVVDNGSDDDELAVLRKRQREHRPEFTLVDVGENRFFSEGNNIGVDHARTDYVVFVNNDAFVRPGWIEALASTMEDDPAVAAVGPMFLYPDGRVQEVGGVVLPTGDVVQVGKGAVWGPDHYDTTCPVDFCSAACLLVRRREFLRVGGFGFEWEPAYYEDVDLCLKLWTTCGKVVVAPAAVVVHVESQTTSDSRLKLHDVSEVNRRRFVAKWGQWLEDRQTRALPAPPAVDDVPTAAATALSPVGPVGRGSVALYSPYPLVPGGGERLLFELAAHLSEVVSREDVVLATAARYSIIRMHQLAAAFGYGPVVGATVPLAEFDPEGCRLSIVLGNSIYPPVEAFGDVCVYLLQFPFWVPDEEVAAMGKWLGAYDEIWVYSEFVRRQVNGLVRHYGLEAPPIRVINPPATWPDASAGLPWPQRRTILTVGRFFAGSHNKRHDVVIEIFRRLRARGIEDVELALAGSIHPSPEGRQRFRELEAMAEGLACTFYPNVARAELAALYGRSAVLVHAAGFGVDVDEFPERLEHFGITPVEASSFGCIPVVYGEGGPAEVIGVLGADTAFHTVDEAVDVVAGLLADPAGSAALSARVQDRSAHYSVDAFRARVDDALRALGVV